MDCEHAREQRYDYTDDDYRRAGDEEGWPGMTYADSLSFSGIFPNPNWDHGVCLACGVVLWVCDYCGAGFVSPGSRSPRAKHGGAAVVCDQCLRCVKCCTMGDTTSPLTAEDRDYAIAALMNSARHHFPKDEKGNPLHSFYDGTPRGDAARYSVEDRIAAAATEAEALAFLRGEDCGGGSGPCDRDGITHRSVEWHARAWRDYSTVASAVPGKQKPTKREAGLYVEFDHRRGVIDPLAIVRAVRAKERRTYVHTGCGGIFTTAFYDGRCHFWKCGEVTATHHEDDDDFGPATTEDDYECIEIADDDAPVVAQATHAIAESAADPAPFKRGDQLSLF